MFEWDTRGGYLTKETPKQEALGARATALKRALSAPPEGPQISEASNSKTLVAEEYEMLQQCILPQKSGDIHFAAREVLGSR